MFEHARKYVFSYKFLFCFILFSTQYGSAFSSISLIYHPYINIGFKNGVVQEYENLDKCKNLTKCWKISQSGSRKMHTNSQCLMIK